jgi:hypothetical protein
MAAYRGTFVAAGQQVADAPSGYNNSLKFTVSTAQASLGSNDELSVLIPIEGVRAARLAFGTAAAAAISFGFWIKAHRTGTYSGSLRNAGKNRAYPFNAADTWEYKTVTISTGDTSGTWAKDTGVGLYLSICIAGGSSRLGAAAAWAGADTSGATGTTNGVAATSDVFQITGVVVLPGIELPASDRAPFIMRPFDQEVLLAKRYWQKSYDYSVAPGTNIGAGGGHVAVWGITNNVIGQTWSLSPRVRPGVGITTYSGIGSSGKVSSWNGSGWSDVTITAAAVWEESFYLQLNAASPLQSMHCDVVINARL